MPKSKLDRMIELADEFFSAKNDPAQISVDESAMVKLRQIHPDSITEERDNDGPIGWFIVIPTTTDIMDKFLARTITERELLDFTLLGARYDALYLCSALVLPEYRNKGIAARSLAAAARSIQKDHGLTSLFYWGWSRDGERLATAIARELGLPLLRRPE